MEIEKSIQIESHSEVNEVQGMIIGNYDIDKDKNINYLIEYSEYLIKGHKSDDKIINWQAENSNILKPLGLDYIALKKKLEEKNKKYYKYDSLINQLSYRLEKHGKLAPTKEIGKKFDPAEMDKFSENKNEGEGQKISDINFYDLNDPFLDDNEVASDNSENEFFCITLAYGNYSEDQVIKNLIRSRKMRKGNGKKKVDGEVITGRSGITKTKKRKYNEMEIGLGNTQIHSDSNRNIVLERERNEKEANEHEKEMKDYSSNINVLPVSFSDEAIDNIIRESMINYEAPKDIMSLIKKLIVHYKRLREDEAKTHSFTKNLSELLHYTYIDIKLIFEFEIHKVKREGIYSNLAKLINKFIIFLTENNIRNISESSILMENSEVREKLTNIVGKITSYIDSVASVGDFLNDENNNENIERLFQSNRVGKMSIIEAKEKIIKKLKENLERNELTYNERTMKLVLNTLIDPTGLNIFFDLNDIEEHVKASTTKTKSSNDNVINLCESRDEIGLNSNKGESPVNVKQGKKKKSKKKNKDERKVESLIRNPSEEESQNSEPKLALFSNRFYTKEYDETDFKNQENVIIPEN